MINAILGITVLKAFLGVVNKQFRTQFEVSMLYQVSQCALGCRQKGILSICRHTQYLPNERWCVNAGPNRQHIILVYLCLYLIQVCLAHTNQCRVSIQDLHVARIDKIKIVEGLGIFRKFNFAFLYRRVGRNIVVIIVITRYYHK